MDISARIKGFEEQVLSSMSLPYASATRLTNPTDHRTLTTLISVLRGFVDRVLVVARSAC